ncbi:hypothetical protein R3P38DRAFT_3336161 [Favolaschia claudopus]|uniref:Uncharacterized protein n=1 Tax=Favolaschia claudopus TaxID=2862362 RepID=A0AAV9Z7N3_9AGAR
MPVSQLKARPAAISVQHTRESSAATAQQTRPSSSSIAASVQADRRASIQRTLHPERASGSTSTSSSNLSPRKRKSGPPRPYSDSAAVPLADFASSSVAVSTTVSITVCILPKVNGAELELVQNVLKRANLVFTVDVSTSGPIFEAIDDGFEDHCRSFNIAFLPCQPEPAIKTPNTTAWILLGPKGRCDPKSLTRFTFTLQAISSTPFSYTPNHLAEGPLHRETETCTLLSTRCLSLEIASLITFLSIRASVVECSIQLLHLSAKIPNPNSPSFPPTSPFLCNQSTPSASLWVFGGRPTGLKFKEIIHEQFSAPRPTITGTMGEGSAFLGLQVSIIIGDEPMNAAVGKGPRNETVVRAVQILLSDGMYWMERELHLTLRLHPSRTAIPARSCMLRATGFIFLLHFLFIGAPIRASPFLFSTIFDGRQTASKFDLDFLTPFMTTSSLAIVRTLHSVPLNQPMYASQSANCVEFQFLLNISEMDPTMIAAKRSQQEQDGVLGTVISSLTLGTADITHHPDYLNVEYGFNLSIDAFGGQDRAHHILEWFATPCKELIVAAFNSQIKGIAELLSHIEFSQVNPTDDPWGDNAETVVLLKQFITHYLTEPGHPALPGNIYDALIDDEYKSSANDPLLRAKLFLSVLTGYAAVPIDPSWKIKCLITQDWNEEFPRTDEATGIEDYGPDVSVFFRACFQTFSISNNARLRLLLLCETPEAGCDTEFGRFFHGQLLASRQQYTGV